MALALREHSGNSRQARKFFRELNTGKSAVEAFCEVEGLPFRDTVAASHAAAAGGTPEITLIPPRRGLTALRTLYVLFSAYASTIFFAALGSHWADVSPLASWIFVVGSVVPGRMMLIVGLGVTGWMMWRLSDKRKALAEIGGRVIRERPKNDRGHGPPPGAGPGGSTPLQGMRRSTLQAA